MRQVRAVLCQLLQSRLRDACGGTFMLSNVHYTLRGGTGRVAYESRTRD
jgi:hypothetical protein